MSLLRISATNLVGENTASEITSPTAATGYSELDLVQGGPARFWKAATAATSFTFDFDLGATVDVDVVAIFGMVAPGTTISTINVTRGSAFPFVATGSTSFPSLNARGDGAQLMVGATARSMRIALITSASCQLEVGQIWIGTLLAPTRNYSRLEKTIAHRTIANEGDDGSVWATRLGSYRHRFAMEFDRVSDTARDEIEAEFLTAAGSLNPIVLLPDYTSPTEVYHGRIQDELQYRIDYPINEGLTLNFTESGRALG